MPIIGFGQGVNGTTFYGLNSGTGSPKSAFFGESAGKNSTAQLNTFIGYYAGEMNTSQEANTFVGSRSGNINKGQYNTFVGWDSGELNKGSYNAFFGGRSGNGNLGDCNVFLGNQTGMGNKGAYNLFSGFQSGFVNGAGSNNTFYGARSGYYNLTGNSNLYLGSYAGFNNSAGSFNVFIGNYAGSSEMGNNKLYIENSSATTPLIYGKFDTDQVGINTTNIPNGFAFAVKGKVIAEEVNIAIQGSSTIWPDYVFNDEYNLPSLKEVEKHIKEKGYLQNIPPVAEVLENGLFLGDMNAKLLQKIEELTLYAIQQQKELELQKEKNISLESRLLKLEFINLNKN